MTSNLLKLRTDYWSADESDDVKMQTKEKTDLLRDMKWLNGVLAMLLWWLKYCVLLLICWWLYWVDDFIEILDDAQITLNWYTYFLKLILTEEPNDYLIVETIAYENFPVSVLFVILLVQGCQDIEWIF